MKRPFISIGFSLLACWSLAILPGKSAEISTVAGTGEAGYSGDGGPAAEARLDNPFGVIVGPDGDIYFCDTMNHVVRKISRKSGEITTVAGTGGKKGYAGDGGPATEALLNEPYEVRFAENGDLFFVERINHCVRKVDGRTGKISTVAGTGGESGFAGDDGPATEAKMTQPHSIVFDTEGYLYICDIGNHRIRRVDPKSGEIETWCGTGAKEMPEDGAKIGPDTPLKGPRALDIDPEGNLWLALREGNAVYKIDMKTKRLHHFAGTGAKGFGGNGGPAKEATLSGPKGVAISPDGKWVYLADTESHTVRAINLNENPPTLELIAGTGKKGDGPDSPDPLACEMARLHGVGIDPVTGDLYIGDSEAHKVRVIKGLPGGKPQAGIKVEDFEKREVEVLDGVKGFVVAPKTPAEGRPWIWRMRFPGAFNQADAQLLGRGWFVGYVDVSNLFGAPEAMARLDAFYEKATTEFGLSKKPVIEGMSRGGLPAMNWSIANPDKVSGIYIDAPVLDIRSWPRGKSDDLWEKCLAAYGLTDEDVKDVWKGGPLESENLAPLAKAKVPILSVCGGADDVVPFAENSAILEERYRKLGGPIEVIVKATCGHHPHSLYDPGRIVEWVEGVVARKDS